MLVPGSFVSGEALGLPAIVKLRKLVRPWSHS